MERRLVEQAQRGDQAAFAEIAYAINPRLFAIAHRILRDFHLAEDATQQAIVLIWRDLPKLADPARFDGWSYRLLINVCYRQARSRRSDANTIGLVGDGPVEAGSETAVVDREMLRRAFDRLTPDQRAVLVLQYYLDLGQPEIARVLGIPVGTVKSRAASARSALRAVLEGDARPGIERRTA